MVPAVDPGISLYVRNKHPAGGKILLGGQDFALRAWGHLPFPKQHSDLKLNGVSWMDYIAQRGYDVYLVDIRGYGKSTRPPEMDRPAQDGQPIVRTDTAVKDVGSTVDFILKRRSVSKINLWVGRGEPASWAGTQLRTTTRSIGWCFMPPMDSEHRGAYGTGGKVGAYRTVSREAAKGRWLTGVPEGKKSDLIPPDGSMHGRTPPSPLIQSERRRRRRYSALPMASFKMGETSGEQERRCTTHQPFSFLPSWRMPNGMRIYQAICCTPTSAS